MEQRLIDADSLKSQKAYSEERHEWIVPVDAIVWVPPEKTSKEHRLTGLFPCQKALRDSEEIRRDWERYVDNEGVHCGGSHLFRCTLINFMFSHRGRADVLLGESIEQELQRACKKYCKLMKEEST